MSLQMWILGGTLVAAYWLFILIRDKRKKNVNND